MQSAPTSSAGYSGTPLPRKLGIKPGNKVLLVGAPPGLDIGPLPERVVVDAEQALAEALARDRPFRDDGTGYDVALFFTDSRQELVARFQTLTAVLTSAGSLWVCWPKRASGVPTDLTENGVRDTALPCGWVDTKVCAIDATWSGLRLVLRVASRPSIPRS